MTFDEWYDAQNKDKNLDYWTSVGAARLAWQARDELAKEEVKAAVEAEREKQKDLALKFYYWWHNQPGANTKQGLDEFMAIRARGEE